MARRATRATSIEKRLDIYSIPVTESGCWVWLGSLDTAGYGRFTIWSEDTQKQQQFSAHRESYKYFCGPIPEGKEIDHLCKVRCCVNPTHLEPVSDYENWQRGDQSAQQVNRAKTHCPRGHPYEEGNLVLSFLKQGKRACLICRRQQKMEAHFAKKRH